MRPTPLDRQWEELMTLCRNEVALREDGTHPKLLKLVASQIDRAAASLGFSEEQIRQREFRADKENGHIVRVHVR